MQFSDIKPNNRIQFKCESEDPDRRVVRGLVMGVGDQSVMVVTEGGEIVKVMREDMLHMAIISYPKILSDSLQQLKNHHEKIYEMEADLARMKETTPLMVQSVYDAAFIAEFNSMGAATRLRASVPEDVLGYEKKKVEYLTDFDASGEDEIRITVRVRESFEYPQFDQDRDVDRLIATYAPDKLDWIKKQFSYATKVREGEKKVYHHEKDDYFVEVAYAVHVKVDADNFLSIRERITDSLRRLG